MNRKSFRLNALLIPMGAAALLLLFLALATMLQPTTYAAGSTIRVPDDYATIQAAIDAAASGDTIQVTSGLFAENLAIDKELTLSGGWDATFSEQVPGGTTVDGQGVGRVISITIAASDKIVTIDGFTVQSGNATGQGGLPSNASVGLELPDRFTTTVAAGAVDIAGVRQTLATRAAALSVEDLCADGSTGCQSMLQIVKDKVNALASAQAPNMSAAEVAADPQVDCGGGIYSWNAGLHLSNSIVQDNIASTDSDGYGGGVCVGQSPDNATVIETTTFHQNLASTTGMKQGYGGGLYATDATGIVVNSNKFTLNTGADAGLLSGGIGGGLMLWDTPQAMVINNQFERNTANAGSVALHGLGGGAYVGQSSDVTISGNTMSNNLGAINGPCSGGGLMVNGSLDVVVANNQLSNNWSCMFAADKAGAGGGGASLYGMEAVTITGNTFSGNIASVVGADIGFSVGGGLDVENWPDGGLVVGNTFTGNVANGEGEGRGGGLSFWATVGASVNRNEFSGNYGSSSNDEGIGGGLYLVNNVDTVVQGNRFQDNIGAQSEWGNGGGMSVREEGPYSDNLLVDANLFLDNQSGTAPNPTYDGNACEIGIGDVTFTNNVVAGSNHGSALYMPRAVNANIVNNTFVDHKGAAILIDQWNLTPITLTNNIIVKSAVGISVTDGMTAVVQYTLWNTNGQDIAGGGIIDESHSVTGTPAFVNEANNDYHLLISSAAVNAGDPAGVPPAPEHDFDGVLRPQGIAVDIGAYELQGSWQFLPDTNKYHKPEPVSDRRGWSIGQGKEFGTAAIVHTEDSGQTWLKQGLWTNVDPGDISAVDNDTAWAALVAHGVPSGGGIIKTTDGGATWVTQTLPMTQTVGIKGIKALSKDEAWAASLDGVILHTTDGGANWAIVPHDTAPITQVNRMDAMGTDIWIADAGNGGAVVHSKDGGATWRREFLPNGDAPLTVHAWDPSIVWGSGMVGSLNPTFYRTLDGGDQWNVVENIGSLDHLDDVCAAGKNYAWGVVNGDAIDGQIFHVRPTMEGTPVADKVTMPEMLGLSPGGVSCIDSQEAWVVSFRSLVQSETEALGLIFYTSDGGTNWVQQSAPTDVKFWKVSFVGALR